MVSVLKYAERECVRKIGWLQVLMSEKCTVKRMDGCEYFIEIITVSLKDLIAVINYF